MGILPINTLVPRQDAPHGWNVLWACQVNASGPTPEKRQENADEAAMNFFASAGLPDDTILIRTSGGDYWAKKPESKDEN